MLVVVYLSGGPPLGGRGPPLQTNKYFLKKKVLQRTWGPGAMPLVSVSLGYFSLQREVTKSTTRGPSGTYSSTLAKHTRVVTHPCMRIN